MISVAPAISQEVVLQALQGVFDPELDESIVELGFVEGVRILDDEVDVSLRLPTFWCAPNFSYLMAHDARRALLALPGVREVHVQLKDNAYSDEISAGVSTGLPFVQVFPGQADGDDLDDLRQLFARKAFGMRQEQLIRFLLSAGLADAQIVALRCGDVLDVTDAHGLLLRVGREARQLRGGAVLARMYLERRSRLGMTAGAATRLVTTEDGEAIAPEHLEQYLQRGRKQRISITFNTLMCRGLLETRYGLQRKDCL